MSQLNINKRDTILRKILRFNLCGFHVMPIVG